MSDERTPLVHTDGDCKCGQFHPTDERTPTAEPVSRWQAFLDHPRIHFNVDANRQFALQWLEDAEAEIRAEAAQRSKESLIAEGKTIMRLDTVRDLTARAEAAQRSTAERPWKEWFEGCQQARAEADAKLITLRAEVERLYTRLVVDGNDVDVNAYHNDPIYKGIVYRIHRGTPRAALAAALVEKENPDER
jgi:hypothetical protein